MDLIITERYQTFAAHMDGKEFSKGDVYTTSLGPILKWLKLNHKYRGSETSLRLETEGNDITIFFTNELGITIRQMTIQCNECDREELIKILSMACA